MAERERRLHVKTKVRPLFPGFSHCACLPLLSNPRSSSSSSPSTTTSATACPKNPSTCSKRASLFIQKFSRQHFPLLCCCRRRSPDVPFLPPFAAPAPRTFSAAAHRHTRLVSSRLLADSPLSTQTVPSYRHRINYLSTQTTATPTRQRDPFVSFPYRRRHCRLRRRFICTYSFSLRL